MLSVSSARYTAKRWRRWFAHSVTSHLPKTPYKMRLWWPMTSDRGTASHQNRQVGLSRSPGIAQSTTCAGRPGDGSSMNSLVQRRGHRRRLGPMTVEETNP